MTTELKPCPFCGHREITKKDIYACEFDYHKYHVGCPNCEARGPRGTSRTDAEDEWNNRKQENQP